MIDHVGVNVSDYGRSRDFYEKALEPLGYSLLMEPVDGAWRIRPRREAGLLDLRAAGAQPRRTCTSRSPRPDRATVDAFHAAAIEAGGNRQRGAGPS